MSIDQLVLKSKKYKQLKATVDGILTDPEELKFFQDLFLKLDEIALKRTLLANKIIDEKLAKLQDAIQEIEKQTKATNAMISKIVNMAANYEP
jgi:hypothetical protein